jgi:hypothetical protein
MRSRVASVTGVERDALAVFQARAKLANCALDTSAIKMLELDIGERHDDADLMTEKVDFVYCNFAIHYFLGDGELVGNLCDNILKTMTKEGKLLVTFLDYDKIPFDEETRSLSYTDKSGKVALSIRHSAEDASKICVFIRSIGKMHDEYIVRKSDLVGVLLKFGFQCEGVVGFLSLLDHCLDAKEGTDICNEVSALYSCAVFSLNEGRKAQQSDLKTSLKEAVKASWSQESVNEEQKQESAGAVVASCLSRLPTDMVVEVMKYLCFDEGVRLSLTSRTLWDCSRHVGCQWRFNQLPPRYHGAGRLLGTQFIERQLSSSRDRNCESFRGIFVKSSPRDTAFLNWIRTQCPDYHRRSRMSLPLSPTASSRPQSCEFLTQPLKCLFTFDSVLEHCRADVPDFFMGCDVFTQAGVPSFYACETNHEVNTEWLWPDDDDDDDDYYYRNHHTSGVGYDSDYADIHDDYDSYDDYGSGSGYPEDHEFRYTWG